MVADGHDSGPEDCAESEPGSEQAARHNIAMAPTAATLRVRFISSPFLRHR
ncbi:hypothetical protein JCM18918_2665 [Cutibacterium acnes JCM 18918]|nr:hypothetical protein JCM18918_2665 [Cutibacterium acnes JCM 18918]